MSGGAGDDPEWVWIEDWDDECDVWDPALACIILPDLSAIIDHSAPQSGARSLELRFVHIITYNLCHL